MSTFTGLAKYYIWCLKSCYVSFHANKARKGRECFLPRVVFHASNSGTALRRQRQEDRLKFELQAVWAMG